MEKKQQKEKKTVEGKLKGAVKKRKMERGKKKAKLKGIAKQWNTKEKKKQNAVSWQSKGLKEIQQEKNLPSTIVQRKKKWQ